MKMRGKAGNSFRDRTTGVGLGNPPDSLRFVCQWYHEVNGKPGHYKLGVSNGGDDDTEWRDVEIFLSLIHFDFDVKGCGVALCS